MKSSVSLEMVVKSCEENQYCHLIKINSLECFMAFYSYVIVIKSHVGMEAMKYIVKNHQLR